MEQNRPQWGSRAGFIMAAVGSAVGLGNIWRFPAVAYENGGGAFFLPYLFALLTAGIPLLIMEFTMGHKYRGSAPLTMTRINRKSEWLGWWQLAISFFIATYYSVIIAWATSYSFFSFTKSWGDAPQDFLLGEYLQVGEPGQLGGFAGGVLLPLLLVWIVTLGIMFSGVKKGIEAATKFMLPLLVILFFIVVVRALTLPGAVEGLNAFFQPDWSKILDGKVWIAAYGQIFFSLSVGFAIMITYSSYLPKKADITNNAFITAFANSSFELLAGFGVFAALGFMAQQQGVAVEEVVSSGIILAFAVFPQIINEFPVASGFFGFLFFISLTLAGLTSLISIIETFVAGLQEKFNISRTVSVAVGGGLSALISLLYATKGGLFFLDTVDHFINLYGIVFAGFVEVILVAWVFKELDSLKQHADAVSDIKLGAWWKFCLMILTPIVLAYMMFDNIRQDLSAPYEDYPLSFLITYGWGTAALAIIIGVVFMFIKPLSRNSKEGL
ncbi:sodium-dependent transporter [Domibacillus sp. PGB-M46]|uniref:sodium-dependent transporter n=1 Tax=Domibacillus sp. PGB-M46 TaxID=2910255 RepID=UPI001F5A780E|nr:sodium-dependent transporter [Domibacillus sp. PGB-M46]MCI2255126.1 sodium-dependent transporter [Domibacillus sp. PGB-M46]